MKNAYAQCVHLIRDATLGKNLEIFVTGKITEKRNTKMEKNELKKALYKQNPTAGLVFIRKGTAYYRCNLEDGTLVQFEIPISDMGDSDFHNEMDSKYLIRWIV